MRRRSLVRVALSLTAFLAFASAGRAAGRDAILAVDGQNFHIEVLGQSGPAIVFEAGQGDDSSTWRLVAGPVSAFARVVLYDRAGLGRSLPMKSHVPVTADAVTASLHALLAAAGIRPPYILVGHSLGGLYAQMFAQNYPREISGVVLLDSASAQAPSALKTRARLTPGTAAYFEEEGVAESNQQVATGAPFPDVPLAVVAATDHGPFFKKWEPTLMSLQQRLAALSPQGKLIVAQGSGHDIQLDRPGLVIEVLRRMARAEKADPTRP